MTFNIHTYKCDVSVTDPICYMSKAIALMYMTGKATRMTIEY